MTQSAPCRSLFISYPASCCMTPLLFRSPWPIIEENSPLHLFLGQIYGGAPEKYARQFILKTLFFFAHQGSLVANFGVLLPRTGRIRPKKLNLIREKVAANVQRLFVDRNQSVTTTGKRCPVHFSDALFFTDHSTPSCRLAANRRTLPECRAIVDPACWGSHCSINIGMPA